eukprot:CAMPEP_0201509294 /NCGR_PEP_ID=MMETSP0161_2-20130828/2392_1 /ASSEMBLY_ACC=CAM_ASM_000251 /TAXON_ID=180227 /ORGANISM="Neoparamoeba aestuarina, Strain SoJaBio B1-5/56/2" /LENGTH=725 /DNA_ID=CAMNT_0047904205 /DNA_START=40 /DNA_END=2214 /DNA_ORIENTATION=-
MDVFSQQPQGGLEIQADSAYDSAHEYLLQPDENVNPVVIDCDIMSYSVQRSGPSVLKRLVTMCGCGNEDLSRNMDEILRDIKSTFNPGEFVCLMGPSGAGKTTLLNTLAARAGGFLIGSVRLNDRALEQKDMRMVMKYIPQDDTLFSALTPRETLTYTAKLRIPNQSNDERDELVNSLMKRLGITRCADVIVGNELIKGISGGQKKRTSVAMELVTDPSILFVDEATSGLDSQTAEDVVRILKEISRAGRTVICTIHQPSFDIFKMFDTLLLLQNGQVVYNGSVADSPAYFADQGYPCSEWMNPADHFMKALGETPKGFEAENWTPRHQDTMMVGNRVIHRRQQGAWAAAWQEHLVASNAIDHSAKQKRRGSLTKHGLPNFPKKFDDDRFDDLTYPTSFWEQFMVLLERTLWMTFKDRQQFRSRLILCTCVSIFTGLTYFQMAKTQNTIQNRQSIVFSSILFNGMNMLTNTVILFPMERAVITREFQNGTYRMIAYYLSRIITSVTFLFAYVFFYVTILYFLAALFGAAKQYLIYLSAVFMVGLIAVTLGLIIGALVPSVNLGPSLVTPVLMPLIVFSGFLISRNEIAYPFFLIYYISFFQYAFNILVVTQFEPLKFSCCCENQTIVDPSTDKLVGIGVSDCFCGNNGELMCPPYCDCDSDLNVTDTDEDTATYYNDDNDFPDGVVEFGTCFLGQGCKAGPQYLEQMHFPQYHVVRDFVVLGSMW